MSQLSEADKQIFHRVIGDTVQHYTDAKRWGMEIPLWLQKQGEAVLLIETNPVKGMALLVDGIQDECDYLKVLLRGRCQDSES